MTCQLTHFYLKVKNIFLPHIFELVTWFSLVWFWLFSSSVLLRKTLIVPLSWRMVHLLEAEKFQWSSQLLVSPLKIRNQNQMKQKQIQVNWCYPLFSVSDRACCDFFKLYSFWKKCKWFKLINIHLFSFLPLSFVMW